MTEDKLNPVKGETPLKQKCIMVIAGEASGDLHGSHLVESILKKDSSLFICGVGGDKMRTAGTRILVDADQLAVMGVTEVLSKLPVIMSALSTVKKALQSLKPDLLILIDYPGFNLKVAAVAKKLGIPVLYYISPKVWAWKEGRVKKIKKTVDHMALILPFEKKLYEKYEIPATYVGNPLLDYNDIPLQDNIEVTGGEPVKIGLLPGSRRSEIANLLPVMLEAAGKISDEITNAEFIVSIAPSADRDLINTIISEYSGDLEFQFAEGNVDKVFEKVNMTIAASGTVTLEAAIAGIPTVIIYKVSPVTFFIGKRFVKLNHVGLASIIAGEEVSPELLQSDASPEKISEVVCDILKDPDGLKNMRAKLLSVRKLMGGPGASERTAEIAIKMLDGKKAFSS